MAKSFRESAKNVLMCFGANIGVGVCGFGNVEQALAGGLGGSPYQLAGGLINLGSTVSGIALSHTWLGLFPPLLIAAVAMTVQQWPYLATFDPRTWLVHSFMMLSFLPAIVEPWVKERAEKYLARFHAEKWRAGFKTAGQSPVQKAGDWGKWLTLTAGARPRLAFGLLYTLSLLPVAVNDVAHGMYRLLPTYAAWFAGVGIAVVSAELKGANDKKLARATRQRLLLSRPFWPDRQRLGHTLDLSNLLRTSRPLTVTL